MAQPLRVTDDTTPAEIAEALVNLARHAARLPHVTGLPHYLTPCDTAHAQIDDLLDWLHPTP